MAAKKRQTSLRRSLAHLAWARASFKLILFWMLMSGGQSIKWLSLLQSSSLAAINSADSCENLSGLNKKQTEICKRNIELMGAVRVGAELAINECQTQFRSRRWNCSALDGTAVFGKILNEGTREAAFVHAITSAGVAYAVTRVCSSGQLMKCGCDRTIYGLAQGFQWAGCSDNVAYGTAFSKTFVDARDIKGARVKKPTASSARSMMNLHNNEAGRKIILENMRIDCKCHGVSGSCELKTCWRATPSFREIGQMLNDKFDSATEVQLMLPQGDGKGLATLAPKARREARGQLKKSIHQKRSKKSRTHSSYSKRLRLTENDLVYIHPSPNYCERDEKLGLVGTHGRACNRTADGADGCDHLCCGRGYTTKIDRVKDRCNCKFFWCCQVECEECYRNIEINACL